MFLRSSTVWTRDKRTVRDITFDAVGKLMHAVPQSKFDYQTRPPRKGSPSTRPDVHFHPKVTSLSLFSDVQ